MDCDEMELISNAKVDFINKKIKGLMENGFFDKAISLYPLYNRMVNEIISPYDHINGRSELHALKTVNIYMSLLGCECFKSMLDFEKWGDELVADYVNRLKSSGISVCEMVIAENGKGVRRFMINR